MNNHQAALIFRVDDINYVVHQEALEKFKQGLLSLSFTHWKDAIPFICIALEYSGDGYTEMPGAGTVQYFIKPDSKYEFSTNDWKEVIEDITKVFQFKIVKSGFITMRECPGYRRIVMHSDKGIWQEFDQLKKMIIRVDH